VAPPSREPVPRSARPGGQDAGTRRLPRGRRARSALLSERRRECLAQSHVEAAAPGSVRGVGPDFDRDHGPEGRPELEPAFLGGLSAEEGAHVGGVEEEPLPAPDHDADRGVVGRQGLHALQLPQHPAAEEAPVVVEDDADLAADRLLQPGEGVGELDRAKDLHAPQSARPHDLSPLSRSSSRSRARPSAAQRLIFVRLQPRSRPIS
jgi:hypothetical protein